MSRVQRHLVVHDDSERVKQHSVISLCQRHTKTEETYLLRDQNRRAIVHPKTLELAWQSATVLIMNGISDVMFAPRSLSTASLSHMLHSSVPTVSTAPEVTSICGRRITCPLSRWWVFSCWSILVSQTEISELAKHRHKKLTSEQTQASKNVVARSGILQ